MATRNSNQNPQSDNSNPKRFLKLVERISLAFEKPISLLVLDSRFNPLYHTGTITLLLLVIILGTGLYLTMFYQFGFDASYQAVADIEANFIGRIMRALHKYASGAAVIFALLHGWRTFFQDRFRGPRWLAWVSGISMAAVVWIIGVSGYWLIWDERVAVLNQTLIDLVNRFNPGTRFLVSYLMTDAAGSGWVFLVLVISIHIGLSALVGLFYWWHIKRLNRPKWLPPGYWILAISVLILIFSAFFPVGMLPPLNPDKLPAAISVDLFYLFYLPVALQWSPLLLWGSITLVLILLAALPWIFPKNLAPTITIDGEKCTGCTLCELDCPYNAIKMIARKDHKRHKYLAEVDPDLCVGCGICIGTCAPLAISLKQFPNETLWEDTLALIAEKAKNSPVKVVFACQRHLSQGAAPLVQNQRAKDLDNDQRTFIFPLSCAGMAHPDLLTKAVEKGATGVQVIGCPPEDCPNREGNLWLQKRIDRARKPFLRKISTGAHIRTDWYPPNDFNKAVNNPRSFSAATGYGLPLKQVNWLRFTPAVLLFAAALGLQVLLSDVNFQPYPEDTATLEIMLDHRPGFPVKGASQNLAAFPGSPTPARLIVTIDGKVHLDETYIQQGTSKTSTAFEQIPLTPGTHQVRIEMFDRPDQLTSIILIDQSLPVESHDNIRLHFSSEELGGDPAAGEKIFNDRSIGTGGSCSLCHSLEPDIVIVGPSLFGIASRAETRVAGLNAEGYLKESIVDPDAYIVDGFPAGQMLPDLEDKLTPQQINSLIAYLLTLK